MLDNQKNISSFFLNSLINYPNNIAISDENKCYTYEEIFYETLSLTKSINSRLNNKKLEPIIILVENSPKSLIGILAIIFSGNIYCPIEIKVGKERIDSIQNTLKNELTINGLNKKIDNFIVDIEYKIGLDEGKERFNFNESLEYVNRSVRSVISTDPCYVIFTSGSTGVPKGVTVSHQGVIDYIKWAQQTYNFKSSDIFASQAPLIFDNSTLDIYAAFNAGASLNFVPREFFSFPIKLKEYLIDKEISVIFWVPSVYTIFYKFDVLSNFNNSKLRICLFAGEVMPASSLKYWIEKIPNALFSNLYGPTEITVDCTYFNVPSDFDEDDVPIGIACSNTNIIVVDENNTPASDGELLIRGEGVALGYWGDKIKTNKAFIQNPTHDNYRDVVYRTGDLVTVKNGLIYYKGRADNQIKLHGYRIELSEIESIAQGYTKIKYAICGFDQNNLRIWLIYSGDVSKVELLKYIKPKLPDYMIPKFIKMIPDIPLLSNGKLDRKFIENHYKENQ